MSPAIKLLVLALLLGRPLTADLVANEGGSIPFDKIGAEAQKKGEGNGVSIIPTVDGARLQTAFQNLYGTASHEGLWLASTPGDVAGTFRVMASALGRQGQSPSLLSDSGFVQTTGDVVRYVRPKVVEEYSVSVDGVRQDFLVLQRPAGQGKLSLHLKVNGATAESAGDGAKLTLASSGRTLAYHRLYVTDAMGKTLAARMEAVAADRLCVVVDDATATYPVRIDPTYSDEDWVSLNTTDDGFGVYAVAVDAGGNVYVGGHFSSIGNVTASNIAKWNGNEWAPLGAGVDDPYDASVNSLVIMGTDLYVGGHFHTAGSGVVVNGIAKWNGSTWSPLGSGVDGTVLALAVSGTDLYVGGEFVEAGGLTVRQVAKWNGSVWSALGDGFADRVPVNALAVVGTDLYAGGEFVAVEDEEDDHGGVQVNHIAKWNGNTWTPLGAGLNGVVYALAVKDGALYVGGDFTTAGRLAASNIAKWNGSAWSALGMGFNSEVLTLAVCGNDLFAGGRFTSAGVDGAGRIARWNGSLWSSLDSGLDGAVYAIAADASGHLFVGGVFSSAGSVESPWIAQVNLASTRTHQILVEQPVAVELTSNRSVVDFGKVVVGSSASLVFSIRNIGGTQDLTGIAVTIGGMDPDEFAITTSPALVSIPPSGITTFRVQFAPLALGSNSARLEITSNDPDENPFDIEISGTGVTRQESWRQTHFGTLAATGDSADDADPDRDGVANLLEFVTGGNPVLASKMPGEIKRQGATLEFIFTRSTAADPPFCYVVWSDSLETGSWSQTGVTLTELSNDGITKQIKATVPAGPGTGRFMRLVVSPVVLSFPVVDPGEP